MPKERITSKIKNVILQGTYGFDVYQLLMSFLTLMRKINWKNFLQILE